MFQDGNHLLLLASVLVFLFHFKKLSKHYESEIFHPSSPYRLCLLIGKVFARPYEQQLIQQWMGLAVVAVMCSGAYAYPWLVPGDVPFFKLSNNAVGHKLAYVYGHTVPLVVCANLICYGCALLVYAV